MEYNFSQWENETAVQLCAVLVRGELERPVSASLYPNSVTATGMGGGGGGGGGGRNT